MTYEDYIEIAEAATPGEWRVYRHFAAPDDTWEVKGETRDDDIAEGISAANARHIATFNPARVLALLALAEGARKALAEMLEMGELFIPTKLDAPGFKRARAVLRAFEEAGW